MDIGAKEIKEKRKNYKSNHTLFGLVQQKKDKKKDLGPHTNKSIHPSLFFQIEN